MMPCCRIESISSCNASRPKSFRGCNLLGTILAKLIWCTLSPDSATSVLAAMEGVPISAPRPLPRPDRAMRLRLPEQLYQRKLSCLGSRAGCGDRRLRRPLQWHGKPHQQAPKASLLPIARFSPLKKFKKSIDTQNRNLVSTGLAPEQTKDFTR